MKKPKKIAYSLTLILQFLLLQLYQRAVAQTFPNYTYQNYTWGLSMRYPSNWYKEASGYYFSDAPGLPSLWFPNIVSFSPTKTSLDFGTTVVSFSLNLIADFPHRIFGGDLTLEEYIRAA
jgi:hypothetical protein